MTNLRHIELYIQLPSQLRHWNAQSIDLSLNNLGVAGSCVHDEFVLRTADGLFNGTATVNLIQSCCTNISNAWDVPLSDLASILAAIQVASHNTASISVNCPQCKAELLFDLNLSKFVSSFDVSAWNTPLPCNQLTFNFFPPTYRQFTEFNLENYRYQKTMFQVQQIAIADLDESIIENLTNTANNLQILLLEICIGSIVTQDGTIVSAKKLIREYLENADFQTFNQLLDYANRCIISSNLKAIEFCCPHCESKFESALNLDPAMAFRTKMIQASEEEITKMLNKLGKESKELKTDILKMMWYMRGSISLAEAMQLTNRDREIIAKIIEDNLKTTQQSGLPFF